MHSRSFRLAALQFAPQLGARADNMLRAEQLLTRDLPRIPGQGTMLVLPEFALSGYDFESPYAIFEHLEPRGGPSTHWAAEMAKKFHCHIALGYPEKVDSIERYNSVVVVNPEGKEIWHYRKTHLYETDHAWECFANPEGFGPAAAAHECLENPELSHPRFQVGICMDLNPREFKAPWNALEFAHSVEQNNPDVVLCPMAWQVEKDSLYEEEESGQSPKSPDPTLVAYWRARLPLSIPAVFANRCGRENSIIYGGSTSIWDGKRITSLGRNEEAVLTAMIELPAAE